LFLTSDPSFTDSARFVEEAIEGGKAQEVRKLLESDQHLFENIVQLVRSGQDALSALSSASTVLTRLREALHMSPHVPLSSIWTRAASGEMIGSPLLRETMLLVKKIPSDKLVQLLAYMEDLHTASFTVDLNAYQQELEELEKTNANSTPLRSQHDVRNDNLRTTVVAQKVLLSKHKAALSEQDKAYSELVKRFHDEIDTYFTATFINPGSLPLSEILIYDLKSPHTEVFQPKPRFAIERALASPHDYLGCECCGLNAGENGEVSLSGTQPSTAILYQMYLESGALINVSDLWSAFNAIAGDEDEESDSKTM
jgi:origin recognition complex subunit 3